MTQRTTIRAALRAAALAAAEVPPSRNRDQATAAITTFLRALPEWAVAEGMPSREAAERLARAVEVINAR